MLRRPLACLLLMAGILPAMAQSPTELTPPRLQRGAGPGQIDWRHRTITVTGEGQCPETGSDAQRRLLGRRAAVADGYRQLAEAVNGVQVTVRYQVHGLSDKNPTTRSRVQAVIKGARPGQEEYLPDGRVRVAVTMPLFGGEKSLAWGLDLGRLVAAVARTAPPQVEAPPPGQPRSSWRHTPRWLLASLLPFSLAETGAVTGVIIDAAGLGAEPAMAPFLLGVGQRVYVSGKVAIDPDRVVQEGVTNYAEDLDEAKADAARIGANPLVVTAKGAVGRPSTDILLSDEDAARLERLNAQWHFLDQLRVTVVI